jgi:hypothetical protein
MIEKLWKKYTFYFHLTGWLIAMGFTAGIVLARVDGYDSRIIKNTLDIAIIAGKQEGQQKTLERMDYNVQIIAQKIGVVPLRKPEE